MEENAGRHAVDLDLSDEELDPQERPMGPISMEPRYKSTVKPVRPAADVSASMPEELLSFAALCIGITGSPSNASVEFSLVLASEFDNYKVWVGRKFDTWANAPRTGSRFIDTMGLGELDEERINDDLHAGGSSRTSIGVAIDRRNWTPETRALLERAIGALVTRATDLFGEAEDARSKKAVKSGTAHEDGTTTAPKLLPAPEESKNGVHSPALATAH